MSSRRASSVVSYTKAVGKLTSVWLLGIFVRWWAARGSLIAYPTAADAKRPKRPGRRERGCAPARLRGRRLPSGSAAPAALAPRSGLLCFGSALAAGAAFGPAARALSPSFGGA